MFEQQLVKMWDEKEDAALDSGDPDAYCLAAANRRVAQRRQMVRQSLRTPNSLVTPVIDF